MPTDPGPPTLHADAGGSLHGLWKERSALLIESTGEGLFGVDMQGRCIFINRAGAQMLGYRPEEALHRNMHELIHHSHPDGRHYPEAECPIFAAFRRGLPCRIDDEVLWRKDGSSFAAEYSSHPIVESTPDGPVTIGAVATFVDISRRKQTELLLKRMNAQLAQSNEELERRVNARTAELSGALAQLRELSAYSEVVRETERTRIAREIHDELGSLLVALKMDVGWLGKRLDDRTELQCKCHGMGATIDRAVGNVGRIITDLRPSILDHQGLWAALEWQAQEFVEASELEADVQLHIATGVEPPSHARGGESAGRWAIAVFRIFQEMLSNVARHAQARSVWIRLYVEGPPGGVLHLEVRDDGIGATREALAHPRSYGMLGMRERAAHFGGRITVETAPQQGTVVRLVMPLPESGEDEGSAIAAARAAALVRAASAGPVQAPMQAPMHVPAGVERGEPAVIRVLVCDDHQIVRQGIKQMLADADGVTVAAEADAIVVAAEAASGAEATRLVRALQASATPLDVVLMDIAMPGRDGLDVLRQLKGEFPKLPVLMLSTYPDKQYAVRSLKLGAAGYLNKSADSEQMSAAIRKVAAGGLFITPAVAEHLASAIGGKAGAEAALHERLSHREYQVFRLLTAGRSVGEIAEAMALSSNTVSTYRARILEKTGARNDVELALYAVRQELQPL